VDRLASTPQVPAGGHWWAGLEAVQVVGHSAYGGGVPVIFGIMDVTRDLGLRPVLLATHPDVVAAARARGEDVWEFQGIVRQPRPLRDAITAVRLAGALRARGVRIVHTHTSKGGMVGRLGAWLAGCPLIIHHTHGFYHASMRPGPGRWLMRLLEAFFARLSDVQVFVNSTQAEEAGLTGVVPRSKVRLVFNGVERPARMDTTARQTVRSSWGATETTPVIGIVCRLDMRTKGLDTAVRVMKALHEVLPDAMLVVAGDGEDAGALGALVASEGLTDAVRLVGHVPDAAELHQAFDVTFSPSRREGQSVAVLEAMACGAAIVATRIAGTEDLISNGESGILVPVDDVAKMVEALRDLLGDPELRRTIGRRAQERYELEFTGEAFRQRMHDVYMEALEASAS